MADSLILTIPQLRTLARVIYLQEEQAITGIDFESEPSLVKYLQECKACYESVEEFLNEASALEHKYPNGSAKASIASDIFGYMVNSANFALQLVRNYTLRKDYMTKIREHSTEISNRVTEVAENNASEMENLAKEAYNFRNAKLEAIRQRQTPASRQFSISLKESGIGFEDLIRRYQNKRNFSGLFNDLEDAQKILVYEDIIQASGRSRFLVNVLSEVVGAAGIALIIFTAGIMVWDLFTANDIFEAATRDAVVTVAAVGGALVGEIVGVTVAIAAGASAAFALMAGIITGFIGAFLIGEFTGWLIDSFFAGTYDTLSATGYRCYVADLPNGEAIARQIAHQLN